MNAIISSPRQVLANIDLFEREIAQSPELQDRLAYARSWYAYADDEGHWHFGPSKFVGYQGMDAEVYIRTAADRDGRRTEAQLRQWFKVVDPASELYEELSAALSARLAAFGKAPSTAMRINVAKEVHDEYFGVEAADQNEAIVELMVAVARSLPSDQLNRLRNRLAA